MNQKQKASRELVIAVCRALLEKKATELRVLDVSALSSITDYMVVATGTSEPHLRALRIEADQALKAGRAGALRLESAQESGWTVIDAFDVMIHLFTEDQRERYRLEHLWKDADELDVAELLGQPKAPAKGKAAAKAKMPSKPKAPAKAKTAPKAKALAKPRASRAKKG
jgi:ribosome-associated protein